MKALVVEDEAEVVEAIVLCLSMPWPDITLIATDSGDVAVEVARWLEPDIILLDLQLNGQYGLQTLQQIRTYSKVPLIIITANGQEISRQRAIQLGADDYLIKPFTHVNLLGSLKAVLGQAQKWAPSKVLLGQHNDGLIVNLPGRQVSRHGVEIDLAPLEWRMLSALVNGEGGMLPYEMLEKNGDPDGGFNRDTAAKVFRALSMKLGGDASNTALLLSRGERGYQLLAAD